jgi:hypothetical protein
MTFHEAKKYCERSQIEQDDEKSYEKAVTGKLELATDSSQYETANQ